MSSSGLNLTQYGTFLLVKCEMHLPAETKTPSGTSGQHKKYWFARSGLKSLNLTRLRVPEFEIAVVGSTEELGTSVVEANVSHCFTVA